MSAATAQVTERDWMNNGIKTVWYNCKNYRAGLIMEDGKLWLRDLTKFDERYEERYLRTACEGWLANYDNLPMVDSRLWSQGDAVCAISLLEAVADIHATERSDTTLCVDITFADGTAGSILFTEEGIAFTNCGDLLYQAGAVHKETSLTFADGMLSGCHNGFTYQVGIDGQIVSKSNGTVLKPQKDKLYFQMDIL